MPATPKRRAEAATDSPKSTKRARVSAKSEADAVASSPRRSVRSKTVSKLEVPEEDVIVEREVTEVKTTTPKKSKAQVNPQKTGKEAEKPQKAAVAKEVKEVKTIVKQKGKVKEEVQEVKNVVKEVNEEPVADGKKPAKQKRKTKEEKEAEMIPLAARTQGLKMFIGAHVSGAGGAFSSTVL